MTIPELFDAQEEDSEWEATLPPLVPQIPVVLASVEKKAEVVQRGRSPQKNVRSKMVSPKPYRLVSPNEAIRKRNLRLMSLQTKKKEDAQKDPFSPQNPANKEKLTEKKVGEKDPFSPQNPASKEKTTEKNVQKKVGEKNPFSPQNPASKENVAQKTLIEKGDPISPQNPANKEKEKVVEKSVVQKVVPISPQNPVQDNVVEKNLKKNTQKKVTSNVPKKVSKEKIIPPPQLLSVNPRDLHTADYFREFGDLEPSLKQLPDLKRKAQVRPTYAERKKRKLEKEQTFEHLKLDKSDLDGVAGCAANIPLQLVTRIGACLIGDWCGVQMSVGSFYTPSTFQKKKLVGTVIKGLNKLKANERAEKRAQKKLLESEKEAEIEEQEEQQQEQQPPNQQQSEVVQFFDAGQLLLLGNPTVAQSFRDIVPVSVLGELTVGSFLQRMERAVQSRTSNELCDIVLQIRNVSTMASQIEDVKQYVAVVAAILSAKKSSQKSLVLQSLTKDKTMSADKLKSNVKLLFERFGPAIFLCLPFIPGFELERVAAMSTEHLNELTSAPNFHTVQETLGQVFAVEIPILLQAFGLIDEDDLMFIDE